MNTFLTIKEVTRLYSVSERTIKRHIHKVTNGVTKYVKHNGRIVVKKESNKWFVMRSYANQFYDLRTTAKSDKESDTSMPKHDMTYDIENEPLVKELRNNNERLNKEVDRLHNEVERLNNKIDKKDNNIEGMMTELYKIQAKQIEAPKKKGWFR